MKAKDHWIYSAHEDSICDECKCFLNDCTCLEQTITELEQQWSVPTKQEIRE